MFKRSFLALLLLGALAVFAAQAQDDAPSITGVQVPHFYNSDLTQEDLAGKVVFITFWGTH